MRRDTSLLAEEKRYIHLMRRDISPSKKKNIKNENGFFCVKWYFQKKSDRKFENCQVALLLCYPTFRTAKSKPVTKLN